jgi:ATP-dependent DNA helicase PIF1
MKCNTVSQLITDIFPEDILSRERVPIDRAILAPLNSVADDVNAEVLQRMPGDEFIFLSRDTIIEDENPPQHRRRRFNPPTYPAEFLNSQEPPGCSPHRLVLKRGCPVILLRNLDVEKGLCNGTRLWVRQCNRTVIQAEIATGRCAGDVVFIPRIPINVTHPNIPFKFCRMQFPLKPAFAMTINKSQGQTLGKVGICLRSQVFSHGQLYVALSRATSPADIKIFSR